MAHGKRLDLEKIALKYPKKERNHSELRRCKVEYSQTFEEIESELRNLGIYNNSSKIPSIGEFQKEFNIISFDPRYFTE